MKNQTRRGFIKCYQQKIEWNPETLQFANGSGDPKWLTREYRGPWKV